MPTQHTIADYERAYRGAGLVPKQRRGDGGFNGPCPICGGTDRFRVCMLPQSGEPWLECNQCGATPPDLRNAMGLERSGGRREGTVYRYTDAAGALVFEVVRVYDATGRKSFRQRHRVAGETIWKVPKAGRGLIYNARGARRAIEARERICICEGEDDCDRLAGLGITATTNAGGAGKWRKAHGRWLDGAPSVVICPDADAPGVKHAQAVAELVAPHVGRMQVLDPQAAFGFEVRATHGLDISDWLKQDRTRGKDDIDAVLDAAPDWEPAASATGYQRAKSGAIDVADDLRDYTSQGVAVRILEEFSEKLLLVEHDKTATFGLRILNEGSGVWAAPGDRLDAWVGEVCDGQIRSAGEALALGEVGDRAVLSLRRAWRGAKGRGGQPVLDAIGGAWRRARHSGNKEALKGITVCHESELDADGRYLGTKDGVIDLQTGKKLSPPVGRTKLVTASTPHGFTPWEEQPADVQADVERLFGHLEPTVRRFVWQVLGFALLGRPSRRIYLAVGPSGGGKSTVLEAVVHALGPEYASAVQEDALMAGGRPSGSGLNPQDLVFQRPRRIAIADEPKSGRLDSRKLKRLSGGGSVRARDLHEKFEDRPATATIMIAANTGKLPWLDLHDEAMRVRCRVIPCPAVPDSARQAALTSMSEDAGTDFLNWMQRPDRAGGVLSRLVWECARLATHAEPPEEPAVVRTATDDVNRDDAGELGQFARRIVTGSSADVLTVPHAWKEWCRGLDARSTDREAGGIKRMSFARHLRQHVSGLPPAKATRVGSDGPQQAWRGWSLLDTEPEPPWLAPDLEATEAVFCAATSEAGVAALLSAAETTELVEAPPSTWRAEARPRIRPKTRPALVIATAAWMAEFFRGRTRADERGWYFNAGSDLAAPTFGYRFRCVEGPEADAAEAALLKAALEALPRTQAPTKEARSRDDPCVTLLHPDTEGRKLDGRADDLVVEVLSELPTGPTGKTVLNVLAAACRLPAAIVTEATSVATCRCRHCGQRLSAEGGACSHCGWRPGFSPCRNRGCGAVVADDATDCPDCGYSLDAS